MVILIDRFFLSYPHTTNGLFKYFGKVEGAYCFRLVPVCLGYKIYQDTVLKFYIWIPHQNIIDTYFFLSLDYSPLWSYAPFKGS